MLKNKKTILIIGMVVVILVAVVGSFILVANNKNTTSQPTTESQEAPVKTVKADDIGLTLKPRSDGKAIELTITKLNGIKTIEYEGTYDAQVTNPEEGGTAIVQQGVTNSPIQVKSGDSKVTREVLLGTCSRNVCKYDIVMSDVKFIFKITYNDGSIGSLEATVSKDLL